MVAKFKYDVVLSFAGEERNYVVEVAKCLQSNDIEYFYDNDNKAGLWGKDLVEFFDNLYKNDARFCVMFISKAYKEKLWTKHERRSALERAFKQDEEYILPARFDNTEIPGIRTTVGHIDVRKTTPDELCSLIIEKLQLGKTNKELINEIKENKMNVKLPDIPNNDFDEDDELEKVFINLENFLDSRNTLLEPKGIKCKKIKNSNYNISYKYKYQNKLHYAIKFWIAHRFRESLIYFHYGYSAFDSDSDAFNAWLAVKWSNNNVMIDFSDFASFTGREKKLLTEVEFHEILWNKIVETIQSIIQSKTY